MRRPHVMTAGVWVERAGLSSRKLSALDQYSSELLNFDEGGVFNLSGRLTVGGAGMALGLSSEVNGGVLTCPKYGDTDPRIELTDQYPLFSAPRSRSTTFSWLEGGFRDFIDEQRVTATGALLAIGRTASIVVDGHRLHEGAALTKATFSFRYTGAKPTSVGTERVGISRRNLDGSIDPTYLHSNGTASGIVYLDETGTRNFGASVEAYYNGGNVINLEYVPNQNNTITRNRIYEFWMDAPAAGSPVELISLRLDYTTSTQRFE